MPARMTQQEFCDRVKEYTHDTVEVIGQYVNKKTSVEIKCKKCNHVWMFSPSSLMPNNIKQHNFIGCPECKYDTVECAYCGKTFRRLRTRLEADNKTGKIYCSKECGNKAKNEQHTDWNNGTNYRRNAFNIYPHNCAICGYNEDERILEVHHIDENRNNNDINNLIILCPNCHKKLSLHLYTLEELRE